MFIPVDDTYSTKTNSANSLEFLNLFESALDESILGGESETPSRTFAPSQIRCKRVSWFRLRGVSPETETNVDRGTNFTAIVGTACHQHIQEILSNRLGADWIDAEKYLELKRLPYEYSCSKNGFETQITITEPVPIRFAPDGIIYWKGRYWLLEIKTSEYSSFDRLSEPKPQHIDQVRCYATLLQLDNVLMLYQDRMYGNLKCFEVSVSESDKRNIWDMFTEVRNCVKMNIAPEKPIDRKYCNPSYCRYYNKCKEW